MRTTMAKMYTHGHQPHHITTYTHLYFGIAQFNKDSVDAMFWERLERERGDRNDDIIHGDILLTTTSLTLAPSTSL